MKRVCYLGIYKPSAPRDKVYLEELKRRGVSFVECVSSAPGLKKYREIFSMARRATRDADLVWVGYLSNFVVPVVYLATRKRIVYNALGSSYEAYILDRAVASRYSPKAFFFWLADFLSFHLASAVLVESESQKRYLARMFLVSPRKLHVVFTGADESIFYPDKDIKKRDEFTVAFRGMFIPATGVLVVLEAAKLLKDVPIRFWISGWGQLLGKVKDYIETNKLANVELNTVFLEPKELREKLLSAHVILGQFSENSRLERTIQHKTTEALALGMPYITRGSESNRELLSDGVDCLFVQPADAGDVVSKINYLKNHADVRLALSGGARKTYVSKLSPQILGDRIVKILDAF